MELPTSDTNKSFWKEVRENVLSRLRSNQNQPKRLRRASTQRRPALLRVSSLKSPPESKAIDALRFWFVFLVIEMALVWGGALYLGRFGAIAGTAAAIAFAVFVFGLAPNQAREKLHAQSLPQHDHWRVKKAFEAWAQVTPAAQKTKLLISELPALFSMSFARTNQSGSIIMSRTLLNRLSEDELFYLVGFELGKIHSGYARAATYAQSVTRLLDWPGTRWLAALVARFIVGTSRWTSGSQHRVFLLDDWMAESCISRDFWTRTIFNLAEMSRGQALNRTPSELAMDPMCALTDSFQTQYRNRSRLRRLVTLLPSPRERILRLIGHFPP